MANIIPYIDTQIALRLVVVVCIRFHCCDVGCSCLIRLGALSIILVTVLRSFASRA